jgi:anti-sigma B factor antagonist
VTVAHVDAPRIHYQNADAVKNGVVDLLNQGRSRLVLDLTDVEFIDSRGLGVLLSLHKSVGKEGVLSVCCPGEGVRRVLSMTRTDQVLRVADDLESALRLAAGSAP